jgi:hypothetical protein
LNKYLARMRAEKGQTFAPDQPSKPSKDPFEGFDGDGGRGLFNFSGPRDRSPNARPRHPIRIRPRPRGRGLSTEQCLDILSGVEAELAGARRLAEPEPSAAERAAWGKAAAMLVKALDPARPRGDATAKQWRQFCAYAVRFAEQGWLHRARAASWSMLELFGGDHAAPFARLDRAGLILLLNGNDVVWITGRRHHRDSDRRAPDVSPTDA